MKWIYTKKKRLHTEALHRKPSTHRSFHTDEGLHFTHTAKQKLLQESVDTQELLHRRGFTHRSFYTEEGLHPGAFTQKSVYTQKLLQRKPFTLYTQELLYIQRTVQNTEAFPQKTIYTQELVHKRALTHRSFYTKRALTHKSFLHRKPSTHRKCYTREC